MKDTISLAFTGDIGFDKYMEGKWEDQALIADDVLAFLHSADHVIANVEGPLVDLEANDNRTGVAQLLHSMNPAAIQVLNRMQADIWNLCNNHMMDAGPTGVEETLKHARLQDVMTIGAGMDIEEASKAILFEEAGGVGMISVGYRRGCKPADVGQAGCFMWHDMERIQQRIHEIKETCRWCIVIVHGGEEFTSLPSPYTRDRFLTYLDMGADVIVCHHPHVPMNYETIGEKVIFYSLGNFIFDTDYQRAQFNTEIGLLVKLHFTKEKFTWDAFGIYIDREKGRITKGSLPRIFTDVQEKEYQLLAPLAAKMMVSAYKRQQKYLHPHDFQELSEEDWKEHFFQPKRSGRVPGEGLDFQIIYPLAEEADKGEWKKSRLEDVKAYILEQIE